VTTNNPVKTDAGLDYSCTDMDYFQRSRSNYVHFGDDPCPQLQLTMPTLEKAMQTLELILPRFDDSNI
jgi:hypothetical protein